MMPSELPCKPEQVYQVYLGRSAQIESIKLGTFHWVRDRVAWAWSDEFRGHIDYTEVTSHLVVGVKFLEAECSGQS